MRAASRLLLVVAAAGLAGCTTIRVPPPATAEASVAFDRSREVAAFAAGIADPATGRAVTPDDPVRIASVSKLVVAIGVMKLVEAGKLDLDADVSRYLGWSLRNPAFPDRPITLRQLLSHTSSVRDGDDIYVIPLGGTLRTTMADPTAWDRRNAPGAGYFTYANLNFPIVASIVENVTQERFDGVMRRDVLAPMKIDACFNWPRCSDGAVARAVVLTQDGEAVRDDLGGKRPTCDVVPAVDGSCDIPGTWRPGVNGALFSPQGGLRISARGLGRIGRMLLNGGVLDGVRILSPQSVQALLTPAWRFDGQNGFTDEGFYCTYGLATQIIPTRVRGCDDDPVGDGVTRVGHAGDAYGLRSGLWLDPVRGTGVAFFVTGLAEDPPRGRSAYRATEELAFNRALSLLERR